VPVLNGESSIIWYSKMDYYAILNLKKEPFSNSPEPEFLYQLPEHTDCLQKLELALRLRRGLNVVIGDVGTGKTTLCRKLIQILSATSLESAEIETHLLLDPEFSTPLEFLQTFAAMLGVSTEKKETSPWHLKEKIKNSLFDKGVDGKKIVVLIIDEGQKIPAECLEILREFLNYETNEFKLLQIVIFAQKEFLLQLKKRANLLDRVNFLCHLKPLNFWQMRAMIDYRIKVAAADEEMPSMFSFCGFLAVYLATQGYPRKVVLLCHQVILKMIVREKQKAGWFLVRNCYGEKEKMAVRRWRLAMGAAGMILIGAGVGTMLFQWQNKQLGNREAFRPQPSLATETEREKGPMWVAGPVAVQTGGEVKTPMSIGTVSMNKRRTIWWTLNNIYGETRPEIVRAVMKANPHIKNINRIAEGTKVSLPAIPALGAPSGLEKTWIAFMTGKDLEKMYNIFQNHPRKKNLPPLAFLTYGNQRDGWEYAIVMNKSFANVEKAKEEIMRLPSWADARAKILSNWSKDTVFINRRLLRD